MNTPAPPIGDLSPVRDVAKIASAGTSPRMTTGNVMTDSDIRFYFSILLSRLPHILGISIVVAGIALTIAYLMPTVYGASAKILVEPPQIPAEMAKPTVQTHPLEQLQIIQQEITRRENLLELAERLDIFGDAAARLSEGEIVENLRARTEFALVPADTQGATIFSVSFQAREPELSARVVNELVSIILEKNMDMRASKAGDTLEFFDKEVARLARELEAHDEAVLEFRNANINALPDSVEFRRNQLSNLQERMLLLEREESSLRVRRTNLVRIFETTGQVTSNGPVSLEQEMLRDLKRSLSEQLSIFSEDSPKIVALRARIVGLQDEVQKSQSAHKSDGVMSDLDLQLSDIDERLAFIEREKTSITKNLGDLARTIEATPQNETTLNGLERHRANIQAQYTNAVAKLAEASTGEQIEIRAKAGRFTLVEPATPPESRVSPNRKRIAGMGVAMGIFLAMGAVIALELMNRTVRRPTDLGDILEEPLLGTVPYIWTPGEQQRRQLHLSVSLTAAICALMAIAATIHHFREPLAATFENIIESLDSSRLM